jgi:hypothetical protein
MTSEEAQRLLHTHLDSRVVEALEVLIPNRLPGDLSFGERDISSRIGEQRVISLLRGVVARREQKARDANPSTTK